MSLPNIRTALVTGASSGIGAAIVEALRAEGVQVWATARDATRVQAAEGVHALAYDLDEPEGAGRLLERAEAESGGIDLLVCNAGFGVFGPFEHVSWNEWERQVRLLLCGTMELGHAWTRRAGVRGRGTFVVVSSLAAEFPLPGLGAYSAAKAGVSAWMTALADEWHGRGLRFVDLRPGDIRTAFNLAARMPELAVPADHPAALRMAKAWRTLDAHFNTAPGPDRVVRDLFRRLRSGRGGVVRTGRFFEARVAPFAARLLPLRTQRALARWYLGLR